MRRGGVAIPVGADQSRANALRMAHVTEAHTEAQALSGQGLRLSRALAKSSSPEDGSAPRMRGSRNVEGLPQVFP